MTGGLFIDGHDKPLKVLFVDRRGLDCHEVDSIQDRGECRNFPENRESGSEII